MSSTFCFILPGLNNSGPSLAKAGGNALRLTRIHQRDWDTPDKDDWVHTINEVIAPFPPEKVILIAHSLACCAVAHWAHRYVRTSGRLAGSPSDVEAPSYPSGTTGFDPMLLQPLPFKSVVIASSNDEYVSLQRAQYFADNWASTFVNIGNKGHINSASGLGDWPEGYELLQRL